MNCIYEILTSASLQVALRKVPYLSACRIDILLISVLLVPASSREKLRTGALYS